MARKVLGVAAVVTAWIVVAAIIDDRRTRQRRELWAEATSDPASR